MNAIGFLIIFVLYTAVAIAAAVWCYSLDPSFGGGVLILLHVFNIGLGLVNIARSIAFGIEFGWKS